MKAKNLVLFGFVTSALNYLYEEAKKDREQNIESLPGLEDLDLEEMRKEIGSRFESTVGEVGEVVSSVMRIGEEAFAHYIASVEKGDEVPLEDFREYLTPEVEEETCPCEETHEEELSEETPCECAQECTQTEEDAKEDEGEILSAWENALDAFFTGTTLNIQDDACPTEEDTECTCQECDCAEENHEECACSNEENTCICQVECECPHEDVECTCECHEECECPQEHVEEDNRSIEDILEEACSGLNEAFQNIEEEKDEDDYLNDIEKAVRENPRPNEPFDIGTLFNDIFEPEHENNQELDDVFNEILDHEESAMEKTEQPENEYVHGLVSELMDESENVEETPVEDEYDDLNEEPETVSEEDVPEEEPVQEESEDDSEEQAIYSKINELYPYLTRDFIGNVYDLKEVIADEYPLGKQVIVLHRITFSSLDDLQQFVEIVSNHGYNVNVDESQLLVDIFKQYLNTDGKILTNIFEIANQAQLLRGQYEGYRIDLIEGN